MTVSAITLVAFTGIAAGKPLSDRVGASGSDATNVRAEILVRERPAERRADALERWLALHDPRGASPYAPANIYCTQFAEDVLQQGTDFPLHAKVDADMTAHEPRWGPLDPHWFSRDGYRYSSWAHRKADAYDSDNVRNYFAHMRQLHRWDANSGMRVGDVLFFTSAAETGIAHTAIVGSVDLNEHVTKVAESTGLQVVYKSWVDFDRDIREAGMQLVNFGRPDLESTNAGMRAPASTQSAQTVSHGRFS